MAHRQLAEDFKLKLKEANDRIFELESTVADLKADLENGKEHAPRQTSTEEFSAARCRIADLEDTLAKSQSHYERIILSANESHATTGQELTTAQRRIHELRHALTKHDDWTTQLERISREPASEAAVELMNLRRQLESARSDEYALREEVDTLKAAEVGLREQLAANGANVISSDVYRERLDHAASIESALRTQAKNWENRTKKLEGKIEKVKSDIEKKQA